MSNIIIQGNEINARKYLEKITIEGIGEEKSLNPRIVVAKGGGGISSNFTPFFINLVSTQQSGTYTIDTEGLYYLVQYGNYNQLVVSDAVFSSGVEILLNEWNDPRQYLVHHYIIYCKPGDTITYSIAAGTNFIFLGTGKPKLLHRYYYGNKYDTWTQTTTFEASDMSENFYYLFDIGTSGKSAASISSFGINDIDDGYSYGKATIATCSNGGARIGIAKNYPEDISITCVVYNYGNAPMTVYSFI